MAAQVMPLAAVPSVPEHGSGVGGAVSLTSASDHHERALGLALALSMLAWSLRPAAAEPPAALARQDAAPRGNRRSFAILLTSYTPGGRGADAPSMVTFGRLLDSPCSKTMARIQASTTGLRRRRSEVAKGSPGLLASRRACACSGPEPSPRNPCQSPPP